MSTDDPGGRLVEIARDRPERVDLDALGICLDADSEAVRLGAAEALARLALSGRDVSRHRARIESLLADTDLLDERIRLSVDDSDGFFQPGAVGFAVSAMVLTGHADPESLLRVAARAHERRHSEFEAEIRRYSAVRDLGWALASVVIFTDAHEATLMDLVASADSTSRRIATAGLAAIAEEYAPICGDLPEATQRMVVVAADRLATDPERRVRYHAAFTLHEFALDDPETISGRLETLRAALDDEYDLVRKEAVGALGVLGVVDAAAEIRELRDDPSERVKEAAASALDNLR
ncbi:MAG: HEAT repeat domain-containing protein [Halobellus sp.]|uniref:HEAT repeat domain-containing protein n=1 Tax=Halobellus sp. TaxID=1979212 RepID=UPI0035D4BCC5